MQKKPSFWISWIVRQPWMVILAVLAATVVLAAGIPKLQFDSDLSDDIPDTIPEKAFYDEVGRIFPSDDVLFIALKGPNGIWTQDYISTIKTWSDAFEGFNGVKGVLSLTNAGLIRGTEAGLEIQSALDAPPSSQAEVDDLRQRLAGQTITEALISKDGLASAILVTLREGLDNESIPRFEVKFPGGMADGALQKLEAIESPLRDPLIAAVSIDPAVWNQPAPFDFSVTMADGHQPSAFETGVRRWIQQKGRVDWKLSFEGASATIRIAPNANETWAKTRDKVEDFIRAADSVTAVKPGAAVGRSVMAVLSPQNDSDKLSAAVNYGVSLKTEEGNLLVVPDPLADPTLLGAAIRAAFPGAEVTYSDKSLPFYFRAQAALANLPQLEGATVFVSGSRAVSSLVQGLLVKDLSVLFPVVVLIIVIILYLSFRTLRGVVLPLLNVILAVVWILGLQGWVGVPLSTATAVLPIILIAVGTAYTIHVINRSYEDLSNQTDKKQALESTLSHVSIPVLLAGVTTIIGFGSLAITSIASLQSFGLLSALGILFGLLLALTFTPSVLSLLSVPKAKTLDSHKASVYSGALERLGTFTAKHPKLIFAVYLALGLIAVAGAPRVKFETNTLLSFRPDTQIRRDTEYLNEQFTGVTQLAVVVRVEEEGGILEPAVLNAMDSLQDYLVTLRVNGEKVLAPGEEGYEAGLPVVGGGQSITTFIKGVNKAINADNPDFDKIPDELNPVMVTTETYSLGSNGTLTERDSESGEILSSLAPSDYTRTGNEISFTGPTGDERVFDITQNTVRDLIPGRAYAGQLVFQYESAGKPENIEAFIDNPRRTARVNIFLKTASSTVIRGVQAKAKEFIAAQFPEGARADLTGQSQLTLTILNFLISTQLTSVLSSLLVILVMISLLSRSFVEGIFSIIPLSVSILLNFGIMGWFGIPIDISTATIASIAIGIGIDYTLHFMERFKMAVKTSTLGCALVTTMRTTGVGILFNAVAVAGGFSALMLSQVTGNFFIGLLMALVMVTSSLGAITLLPAILLTIRPKFLTKGRVVESELDDGFGPVVDRCVD